MNLNQKLRVIVATTAFWVGSRCPLLMSCNPLRSTRIVVQDAGRARRSGNNAEAVLYDIGGWYPSKVMKQYAGNMLICRQNLFISKLDFMRLKGK